MKLAAVTATASFLLALAAVRLRSTRRSFTAAVATRELIPPPPLSSAQNDAHSSRRAALFIDDVEVNYFTQFQIYLPRAVSADRLRAALQAVQQHFPFAGAGFSLDAETGRWDLLLGSGGGIDFIHLDFTKSRGQQPTVEQLAAVNLNDDDDDEWAQVRAQLALPSPPFSSDWQASSPPPVTTVQLASFPGGGGGFSVLSFTLAHFYFDGTTRFHFCKTLSDLCGGGGEVELPPFTHQVAMCDEEFAKKLEQYKRATSPYHTERIPADDYVPVQFVLSKSQLDDLMQQQQQHTRCSTHEAVLALIVHKLLLQQQCSTVVRLFNICNLRARLPQVFSPFYLGNAAGLVCTEFTIAPTKTTTVTVQDVAAKIHASAASGMTSAKCEESFFANEAYGTLVLTRATRQRATFLRLYQDKDKDKDEDKVLSLLVNSWRHQDWYALDFGTGAGPQRVGLAPTLRTQPLYVHIEQCSPQGDLRVFAMLRRGEAGAF